MAGKPEVILYSRHDCHLCDVAKETLLQASHSAEFSLQVVDIDGDPDLRIRFNEEVPVVFINGTKAFKYQVSESEFLRKLCAR